MHPQGFEPMLASNGKPHDDDALGWEPKLDGWHAMLHVDEFGIRVFSRPGRDITSSVPELAPIAAQVAPGTVLDGELVAGSGGAWSFYRLGPLLATTPALRRSTIAFAAFDILAVSGESVMDRSYEDRRLLLENLGLAGSAWCTVPSWRGISVQEMLAVCERHGVEGLVGKKLRSRYVPGQRRPDWVKAKTSEWRAVHADRRHEHRAMA